ncbi:MFS transporter [Falsiroseomonas sp. HW251]|uniref:MFS transporter n=1 Tax=Falsiroseomonas sp. HW251 TaxID=3390998 RepID=UPI003D315988
MKQPLPWALIASAAFAMFAISASGNTRAPFLIEMARDLETTVPLTANLMAVNAVAWGIASLLAGSWSDRIGRRPFLIGGPVGLTVCMTGVALAETYWGVAFWVTLAGFSAGAVSAAVATEVSSRVPDGQRGRALGWALSGQSIAMLLGLPLAAAIGAIVGWRGVHLGFAAVTFGAAAALFLVTRAPAGGVQQGRYGSGSYRAALTGPVARLLLMGIAERSCYALAITFFASFLQLSYGVSVAGLAVPLMLFAGGNILGTLAGGQLADRFGDRKTTYGVAMVGAGLVSLPLFLWQGGVAASVVLGFLFVLCTSVARPCVMASLGSVPEEIRGTVLGLNVTSACVGWLGAAALGGLLLAFFGFGAFAAMTGGFALLGAVLAFTGGRRTA